MKFYSRVFSYHYFLFYLRYFSNYYIKLLTFLFLSFPFSCIALSDKQEECIYQYLQSQWKRVDYHKPPGFDTIFQNLPPSLWPALPESYEWRIEKSGDNEVINLYRHVHASHYTINFVTYPTNDSSRFNFLSCWDGATRHSFTYPRKDNPFEHSFFRNVFPFEGSFKYAGKTYVRGHCIDFSDTHGLIASDKVNSSYACISSISTLDPRNFIPEPCREGADKSPIAIGDKGSGMH